jgi:hypothetical protein
MDRDRYDSPQRDEQSQRDSEQYALGRHDVEEAN